MELNRIPTPALVVDQDRMDANLARLRTRLDAQGVTLRPHMKTLKSVLAAMRIQPGLAGPITVSTLREAEVFAEAGARDIIYAAGITADKLDRVAALRRAGCDLKIILDSVEQAEAVIAYGGGLAVLIEVDPDGTRAGVDPSGDLLLDIARALVKGGADLQGVLAHAGGSYAERTPAGLAAAAEAERLAAVTAAERLRAAGFPAPIVSVGSTPTAHFADHLDGVTEVRAGNYALFDLVMLEIGVCDVTDIAGTVLVTVTGSQPERGRIFTDGGWTALSPDRGTGTHGMGLVADVNGTLIPGLIVTGTSQEHGVLGAAPGHVLPEIAPGTRLRIMPNHACATAAMHDEAVVVAAGSVVGKWPIFRGW